MGYLMTQMLLYMIGAFLLGLLLGWLIWGRRIGMMAGEIDTYRSERDRARADLDACGRDRADLEARLRAAEARAADAESARAKAEAAKPAAPMALMAAPAKPAAAKESKPAAAKPAAVKASRPAPKPAAPKPVVKDDLRLILGIGKTNEKKLHDAGVTRFAQIAGWSAADIRKYGDLITFGERIVKENWVEQAKLLAKGDMDAFYKAFPAAKGDTNT